MTFLAVLLLYENFRNWFAKEKLSIYLNSCDLNFNFLRRKRSLGYTETPYTTQNP